MRYPLRHLLQAFLIGAIYGSALLGQSLAAADKHLDAYFIGNSLTMSTTLDRVYALAAQQGTDLQFGSQLSAGKSLIRHFKYLKEPEQNWKSWETNVPCGESYSPDENLYVDSPGEMHRFGLYDKALPKSTWDAIVFQLYESNLHDDLEAISGFVQLSLSDTHQQPEYLIYSTWPRRPKERLDDGTLLVKNLNYSGAWHQDYLANPDDTSKKANWHYASRDYVATLLKELAKRFPQQHFRLIPTGEVIAAIDAIIRKDKLPGLRELASRAPAMLPGLDEDTGFEHGANVLYADAIHFNPIPHQSNSLGIFITGTCLVTGLTGESPIGLSGAPYGLDDVHDAELILAIQTVIWEVFQNSPVASPENKRDR